MSLCHERAFRGAQTQSAALMSWSSGAEGARERLEGSRCRFWSRPERRIVSWTPFTPTRSFAGSPNAILLIYGDAGHAFLFQHPHEFGRQVLDFLQRVA